MAVRGVLREERPHEVPQGRVPAVSRPGPEFLEAGVTREGGDPGGFLSAGGVVRAALRVLGPGDVQARGRLGVPGRLDRKSTRLNSSHT